MSLLLDTNVLVWLYGDEGKLSRRVIERLEGSDDKLFVSVVSGWEYGQKRLRKPRELTIPFEELIGGIPHERLELAFEVHRYAETLPLIHRDPFDRMLIAQALHHGLTLVASDDDMSKYDVPIFW